MSEENETPEGTDEKATEEVDSPVAEAPVDSPVGSPVAEPAAAPPAEEPQAPATCALHPGADAAGTCTHCGNFGCENCLGHINDKLVCRTCVEEQRVAAWPNTPWERRKEIGVWQGLWQTVKLISTEPNKTFAGIDPNGGLDEPVKLALLANVAMGVVLGLFMALAGLGIGGAMLASGEMGGGEAGLVGGIMVVYGLVIAIFTPMQALMYAFIYGLVTHGCLKLLGGGNKGLTATLRASLYACVIMFWNITICGGVVTGVWWLVLQILAVARIQEESTGKVAAAVLLPAGTCFCMYFGLIGLSVILEEM